MTADTFHTGDRVSIRYAGRTVDGEIVFASANGGSLFVQFEALLGGYAGLMPVLGSDDGTYIDLVAGQPVELAIAPERR